MKKGLRITLNGEAQHLKSPMTVEGLLAFLGLPTKALAVERNLEIVPRSAYPNTALREGDRIEIVHFVGGG